MTNGGNCFEILATVEKGHAPRTFFVKDEAQRVRARSAAACASARFVMPHILTRVLMPSFP